MWNSVTSYFSSSCPPSTFQSVKSHKENLNDWVLVDGSGQEIEEEEPEEEDDDNSNNNAGSKSCLALLLDVNNSDCSPLNTPSLSPTQEDSGWFITPPPCFTVDCPIKIEISPLEDLLIEHPSMSVYGKLPELQLKKETPLKFPSLGTIEEPEEMTDSMVPKAQVEPRSRSLGKTKENISPKQRKEKQAVVCTKKVTAFLLNEDIKLSQRAKYHEEQFNCQPTFLERQNLVHHSKNSLYKNKRMVMKPFGEKCKRAF